MTVRTRVAPSPTGDPHVGTAYMALFNRCFAHAHGGQFILRIEDTDQVRSTPEAEAKILESLRWLGLDWDEGPDLGGPKGPYRQSERAEVYSGYAWELVEKGHAFVCYRTPEELNALREARREAGKATALKPSELLLSEEEQAARKAAGASFVIRMVVPEEAGACVVEDMLRGTIELDWSMVDAQILLKSDGLPTYHLANVVDDHLMEITHVIRGEEWINSAPKHQLLYGYFGWAMPVLCHLPLLRNPDKSKLSKRKNPTSILYYQRMGFLPEAVVNYLGRMGWSMPDEQEKFTLSEMQEAFDINRVSLGGPVFDVEKLKWLNGLWIRESLSTDDLIQRLQDWALNREMLEKILPQAQGRIDVLSDLIPQAAYLLSGEVFVAPDAFGEAGNERDTALAQMQCVLWRLEAQQDWRRDALFAALKALAEAMGIKPKALFAPLFVALSGQSVAYSIPDSMAILGPDMTRARLRHAIDACGGVSKKALKRLEKEYAALGL
ncbi:MAG: glutamate--tRNA ligase [Halieaceae bacterium]|nr:glutamate--tRNA ligase [Halieaceae bacterium]